MQTFTQMRVRALIAACAAYAVVVVPVAAAHAQTVTFSIEDFRKLTWLRGDWRGMAGDKPFFESYRLLNDSTIEKASYSDSTFRTVQSRSVTVFRAGAIMHESDSGSLWTASAIADGTVTFQPTTRATNSFVWTRTSRDEWSAVLRTRDGRTTEYAMQRSRGRNVSDREAVVQAGYDYIDGLYLVDPSRIERSFSPDLKKRGFSRRASDNYTDAGWMTYEQLLALAGTWNKAGRLDIAKAPREVVVYEVMDQTASAKITAQWGIDYLHLARIDGAWKIVNVMWQSPPSM